MRGALLSVGDELVLGQSLDTNGAWLALALGARSIEVVEHRTVGDDRAHLAEAIAALAGAADVLVITGGLGPTEDDLTRFALGDVTDPGADLVEDAVEAERLRRWIESRSGMPASNLVQARRPPSLRFLPNRLGTAPGLAGRIGACRVFALPGPPREMKRMFEQGVAPDLGGADGALVTAEVRAFGLGESTAAARLGNLTDRARRPRVGTTASADVLTARIFHRAGPGAEDEVEDTVRAVERAWAPYAFGRSGDALAAVVGRGLVARSATLVTAESCTGGWIAKAIVDVAGASAWYRGGWVTYANDLKSSELGVDPALIARDGAVAPGVASAMADGALARGGADLALSVTGIAGPEGEGPRKPAGLVFIGLAERGAPTLVRGFRFRGDRSEVRQRTVMTAFQLARFRLEGADPATPLSWDLEPEP